MPGRAFPDPLRSGYPDSRRPVRSTLEEPELLHLRLLPPKSYRRRHDPPEWAIEDDAGRIVGWVEEVHLPTAGRPFFALAGVHPGTGERIDLQLSSDREERIATLERFLIDPDSCAQHFSTGTRARRDWDAHRPAKPWELGTGKPGRHG